MQNNTPNKILVAVLTAGIVALGAWTVKQTHETTLETAKVHSLLAAISQKVDDGKEARLGYQKLNDDGHQRIEIRLGELISKREFDAKMASMEAEIKQLSDNFVGINSRLNRLEDRTPARSN